MHTHVLLSDPCIRSPQFVHLCLVPLLPFCTHFPCLTCTPPYLVTPRTYTHIRTQV
jgi:hypothetical protein